ncbi:MAG: hypothetical protein ACYC2E_12705, partial [Sulfuricella sp.]
RLWRRRFLYRAGADPAAVAEITRKYMNRKGAKTPRKSELTWISCSSDLCVFAPLRLNRFF